MKVLLAAALFALLSGCGSAPSGPKTALTRAQFEEVKLACNLGGATFGSSNSTKTTTNADGSTSTVTIEYEGAADQTSIALPDGMAEGEVAKAIVCLSAEFDRLGAEARVRPPGNFGL
jgi:hypothetical protein